MGYLYGMGFQDCCSPGCWNGLRPKRGDPSRRLFTTRHDMTCIDMKVEILQGLQNENKTKHTAQGIPTWSPTVVLILRSVAYVCQSGRDGQYSTAYGRMYRIHILDVYIAQIQPLTFTHSLRSRRRCLICATGFRSCRNPGCALYLRDLRRRATHQTCNPLRAAIRHKL